MDSHTTTKQDELDYIKDKLSMATRLECLAEEASELAQAALKTARILRNENPTPVTLGEAKKSLTEEFTDVCLSADMAEVGYKDVMYDMKLHRWYNKIKYHRMG